MGNKEHSWTRLGGLKEPANAGREVNIKLEPGKNAKKMCSIIKNARCKISKIC